MNRDARQLPEMNLFEALLLVKLDLISIFMNKRLYNNENHPYELGISANAIRNAKGNFSLVDFFVGS